jgi:hypothetical protein
MMAETVVYAREFLFVKELYEKGELGKIQFLQASHQQDMDGWPNYWPGLPPMHYATHCVGPVLALTQRPRGVCLVLRLRHDPRGTDPKYNSPFAVETAHIKFKDSDLTARIYPLAVRRTPAVPREHRRVRLEEDVRVAADRGRGAVLHTAKKPEPEIPQRVKVPDYAKRCPKRSARSRTKGVYDAEDASVASPRAPATAARIRTWRTNSSPRVIEDRDPFPNAVQSANWTCVGSSALKGGEICAHESALVEGGYPWRPIVQSAEDQGVRIGIENCPMLFSRDEWPAGKNLAHSPAIWRRMFEDIPSPNFGLNYDPSHMVWQHMDYLAPIREFRDRIFHVHAKDVRVDQHLLNDVGVLAFPPAYHTPKLPGMGDVDWGKFCSVLTDVGYRGPVCVEVEDRAYEDTLDRRKASLHQSRVYLRNFIPG